jgi:hypothetical protein
MNARFLMIVLAVAVGLAWCADAPAAVTSGYRVEGGNFISYDFATAFTELDAISADDLINGFGVNNDDNCNTGGCITGLPINQGINESAIAPFALGWIDPNNGPMPPDGLPGVGSWYMESAGGCRQIFYDQNSSGFHPVGGNGDMADLVDGQTGNYLKSVLRDFARASLVVRYGFENPTDIGQIRIFAANLDIGPTNPGRMGRVFQYYDVYARQGDCSGGPCPAGPGMFDGFDEFFPVAIGVSTGNPGLVTNNPEQNPAPWEGTQSDVVNFNSNTLIPNCTDLRIVLYCVSNTQGFFIDPWQGYVNDDPAMADACTNSVPPEPEDTDGYMKAFEAPIIKEIDVFGPIDTPFGDIDYDADQDLFDAAAFQRCFNGDVSTNGCYRFDYEPDADVDGADWASFRAQLDAGGPG